MTSSLVGSEMCIRDSPNGTATLKFILQNINFTITEKSYDVALSRPDFPYLTLISGDQEYRMEKVAANQYSVTGEFAQKVKGYIKAFLMIRRPPRSTLVGS
eukprot:3148931-Prorocentrum_lima.AAC.1